MNRLFPFVLFAFVTFSSTCWAQKKLLDKVIATVGNEIVLLSDLENQYQQAGAQGGSPQDAKCMILEDILLHKLLVNQAQIDSIEVSDAQVEAELNKRMRYFIAQLGSEQKLEEYMGKSIVQIKTEYKDDVRDMLLAQSMQQKITSGMTVSPAEVKDFYNSIPKDSIPLISSEIELGQIVKQPPINEQEKKSVKEKLEKIRERIVAGEDFATLAVLYSEDPGSAKNGGELGFVDRNDLVPEFSAVAFNLKGSEVSKVVESTYGFHIIQLIERRGEQINVRHILMTPKTAYSDLSKAEASLDSVYRKIKADTLKFADAALRYSDDEETKNNGGLMVNPQTGSTRFTPEELDQTIFFTIDKLKVGEVSAPVKFQTRDGKTAYRIIFLKTRTEPHKANLKEDYQTLQSAALNKKQSKVMAEWIRKKKLSTYVKVDTSYNTCKFQYSWF
jgi:peptidyl-prolyl cis-trans isomerase SurA